MTAFSGPAPNVVILLGSKSDLEHRDAIARGLETFGLTYETRIASAHSVTSYLLEMLRAYENDGQPRVYITVDGRSNALSEIVDANTRYPVIACLSSCDRDGGMNLLATVRMPGGVAPLLVLEPEAASLAAAKIMAIGDSALASRIANWRQAQRDAATADDRAVYSG